MSQQKFAGQDLPPPGGYNLFHTERTRLRNYIKPRYYISIFLFTSTVGLYVYSRDYKKVRRDMLEMSGAKNAIMPILMAEKDRQLLKHMKKMREYESELMKDVDGWTVGKYYGEPIYMSRGQNFFSKPTIQEFYMFSDPDNFAIRAYDRLIL